MGVDLAWGCVKGSRSCGRVFAELSGSSTGLAATTWNVAAWIAGRRSGARLAAVAAPASAVHAMSTNNARQAARPAAMPEMPYVMDFPLSMDAAPPVRRSEEHTYELQSLMRIS